MSTYRSTNQGGGAGGMAIRKSKLKKAIHQPCHRKSNIEAFFLRPHLQQHSHDQIYLVMSQTALLTRMCCAGMNADSNLNMLGPHVFATARDRHSLTNFQHVLCELEYLFSMVLITFTIVTSNDLKQPHMYF